LFDVPDEDGMTALPLGSSLESVMPKGKDAAGETAGGDEVAGSERSDREIAASDDPYEGASRAATYEAGHEAGVTGP